jgi:spore germination cell wall hydrolase CwlJ-like protein
MKASRKRPKGAFRRPFGLVLGVVAAMPNSIGHQDLAALIARQPAVTERWRAHVRNSTFGTLHAASLSFPRLVGASIPDPYFTQLAALDPRALEATGSIPLNVPTDPVVAAPTYDFPIVERRLKGDRLTVKPAPGQPEPARPPHSRPSKSKDMASRPPLSEAVPAPDPSQSMPAAAVSQSAPKGDRLAPSSADVADAARDPIYRRGGLAAGQGTLAKRLLGTGPRMPAVFAAPAEPVADKTLHRAGLAAGQRTLAKRVLGTAPRMPVVVADKPVEQAPAQVASVEAEASVVAAKPLRRAGIAAAHIKQVKIEASRTRSLPPETADLESQRADLRGPIVPPSKAEPAPEVAQLAPAPRDTKPEGPEPQRASLAEPKFEHPASESADIAVKPDVQVASILSEPARATIPALTPAPAVAAVSLPAPEKTPDRFNAHAADQLAQFAKPAAQNRVFFGTRELGMARNEWEAWEPGESPTVLAPPHVDTEIKRAALDPIADPETEKGGETIAPKGEVTGEGKRPRTPAERLNLVGASRVKHARCLANAIYFEARGEVERGQMAVAQVVLNRVFTGYYPGSVCDVVYQNAHRKLACQFTFACDNHKDVVRDQKAWEIATRISDDALDGKFWLPEVGKATHYHATYVNPWWVRTMTKHTKLGIHIFYRPKRWGDGEDIPVWGDRLEATGSIKRTASPAAPEMKSDDKRADAQPAAPARRSIFDPVEPLDSSGG